MPHSGPRQNTFRHFFVLELLAVFESSDPFVQGQICSLCLLLLKDNVSWGTLYRNRGYQASGEVQPDVGDFPSTLAVKR
jgi:hypothetical protein